MGKNAEKERLLKEIEYYTNRIKNFHKVTRPKLYIESSDSEDDLPTFRAPGPTISELRTTESALKISLQATQELTRLTVLQFETNVMVASPQLKCGPPITEPGIWREVTAECKIDVIPFSITFYTHKGNNIFAPTSYRNLSVLLVKKVHEVELGESVLPDVTRPSDAIEMLKSYANAFRSRRSSLARLANKYSHMELEPATEGGFLLKCGSVLSITWRLENKWTPLTPFHHNMKFELDYMDKDKLKIIKQAHKKISDPTINTDERTLLLAKIISTCLEVKAAQDESMESEAESTKKADKTIIEDTPDDNLVIEHDNRNNISENEVNDEIETNAKGDRDIGSDQRENEKEIMAPPKSLPKKAKPKSKDSKVDNTKTLKRTGDVPAAVAEKTKIIENGITNEISKQATNEIDVTKNKNHNGDARIVQTHLNTTENSKQNSNNQIKRKSDVQIEVNKTKKAKIDKNQVTEKNVNKNRALKTNIVDINTKSNSNVEKTTKSTTGTEKTAKSNSNVEKTTKSTTGTEKTAKSNSNVEKTTKSTTGTEKTAKSNSNVEKTTKSTTGTEKTAKSNSNVEKTTKSTTGTEKPAKSNSNIKKTTNVTEKPAKSNSNVEKTTNVTEKPAKSNSNVEKTTKSTTVIEKTTTSSTVNPCKSNKNADKPGKITTGTEKSNSNAAKTSTGLAKTTAGTAKSTKPPTVTEKSNKNSNAAKNITKADPKSTKVSKDAESVPKNLFKQTIVEKIVQNNRKTEQNKVPMIPKTNWTAKNNQKIQKCVAKKPMLNRKSNESLTRNVDKTKLTIKSHSNAPKIKKTGNIVDKNLKGLVQNDKMSKIPQRNILAALSPVATNFMWVSPRNKPPSGTNLVGRSPKTNIPRLTKKPGPITK